MTENKKIDIDQKSIWKIKNKSVKWYDYLTFIFGLFLLAWIISEFITKTEINPANELQVVMGQASDIFTFTTQSNIILSFSLMLISFVEHNKIKQMFLASLIWITVTFVIYWVLISWTRPWGNIHSSIDSIITHAISPVVAVVIFFVKRKEFKLELLTRWIVSIYLVIYYLMLITVFFATQNNATLLANYNANGGASQTTYLPYVIIYGFANPYRPLYVNLLNATPLNIFLRIIFAIIIISLLFALPILFTMGYLKLSGISFQKFMKKSDNKYFKYKLIFNTQESYYEMKPIKFKK
ncbi:hypothetical protein EI74_0587 [Mycoplasma testudineum]|uniref:Uncharacterized protein n=1 Tax=Mycoplasma testudineum TaxID=244584 RepID=A0A4R6ID15_9MOLU|nr:hypothetical protein [Mycoplasma testudineum]OYD26655.1 hypothetical protein CG473_02535 [Mycoplasma testudineum]TDO19784.1 hypothetical protein EI74_0587 [Mycoplasma testudineum]